MTNLRDLVNDLVEEVRKVYVSGDDSEKAAEVRDLVDDFIVEIKERLIG